MEEVVFESSTENIVAKEKTDSVSQHLHPLDEVGIWSRLTGAWLIPLFVKGYRRPLEKDDLYNVQKDDASVELGSLISRFWEEEVLAAGKMGRKPIYIRALLKAFGVSYCLAGILVFIEACILQIGQPICLGGLIRYFNREPGYPECYVGILFALGIVLGSFFYIGTHHSFFWIIEHTGMRIRVASCSLLYRKTLKLSNVALSQTTVGQMVNLLSNDVSRFDLGSIFPHYLWVAPLQTFIVTIILWHELGPSCLAGIALLIMMVPLQGYMGRIFSRLRLATALETDERVRITDEIINAMRVIKMFAWEKPFTAMIKEARKKEIDIIMKTSYYRALQMSIYFTSGKMIVFLSLLVYVLTGNELTAEKVFVTCALINNIRFSMTLMFPLAIFACSEMYVSCSRIQNFLELEEKENSGRLDQSNLRSKSDTCSVEASQFSASWNPSSNNDTLKNISFEAKAGQLLVIIGAVGSGKSSLFNAILGELPIKNGSIKVEGKIGYASQEPWLIYGTVKQNILFGQIFEAKKYYEVLRVCDLVKDLKTLPNGDQTLVGERGAALSGGQKARINLARSIYFDADIYLLDDPLSAVDSQVGKKLYEKCFCKFLSGKVRILITHHVQHIETADHIILLRNGEITAQGTYAQLKEQGIDFADLIGKKQPDEFSKKKPLSRFSRSSSNQEEDDKFDRDNCHMGICRKLSLSGRDSYSLPEGVFERNENNPTSDGNHKKLERLQKKLSDTLNTEMKSTGSVGLHTYGRYFVAGGGLVYFCALIFMSIITQTLYAGSDYWLSFWVNQEQLTSASNNLTYVAERPSDVSQPFNRENFVYIYSGMSVMLFISSLMQAIMFFVLFLLASRRLHLNMFKAIIEAPIKFFNTHPNGQILNRFTKDLGQIDALLPATLYDFITIVLTSFGVIVIITIVNVWNLLPTSFLAVVFYFLRKIYLSTSRDIKRLEGITKSPVFSHLSSSLQGLTTIRALGVQDAFIKDFDDHQDLHSRAWNLTVSTTRCFGIWLDALSCIYLTAVTCSFFGRNDAMIGSNVGLAISCAMMLSGMFQWGVRQSAEVENQMTSVERILEYSRLEPESSHMIVKEQKKADWPSTGNLSFQNVYLYYNKEDPPVLKDVSFTITAGQKIGIVGRTGAGKSSLLTCLFRLAHPEGKILIDDIDTDSISLSDLRESISIIPQDPTLFSGSVRKNLDLFSKYSDEEIWNALEEVQMKNVVSEMSGGLSGFISEGGGNLSVGQRQLICLARAILKNNKILVMDEATANVDPQTDNCIQKIIRWKFANCTVLTIAHRLNTVMDCDKILVMESGKVEGFAAPCQLLKDKNTLFANLVRQSGSAMEHHLRQLAEDGYCEKQKAENVDTAFL